MIRKNFALALPSLVLLAGVAGAATPAQRRPHAPEQRPPRPFVEPLRDRARAEHGRDSLLARIRARIEARREELARRVIPRLGVTDEQRARFRAQAEAAKPVVESARAEVRRILEQARERARDGDPREAREWARGEIRAVMERSRPQIEPNARKVVQGLTPEQREKLDRIAKLRGRELDDQRLTRGAAWLLAHRSRGHRPPRPCPRPPGTPRY